MSVVKDKISVYVFAGNEKSKVVGLDVSQIYSFSDSLSVKFFDGRSLIDQRSFARLATQSLIHFVYTYFDI